MLPGFLKRGNLLCVCVSPCSGIEPSCQSGVIAPSKTSCVSDRSKYSSKVSVCVWCFSMGYGKHLCKAFCDKTPRFGSLFAHQAYIAILMGLGLGNNTETEEQHQILSLGFSTFSTKWDVKGANPRTPREVRRTCSRISTMPEYYLSSLSANKSCSFSKQPDLFRSFQSTCSLTDFLERKTPFSRLKCTPKWGSPGKVPE